MIRNGEMMKIPVLAVIGFKESEARGASLRSRSQGELGLVEAAALVEAAGTACRDRLASLPLAAAEPVPAPPAAGA
jgi:threonyl-tRNA synthetase